MKDVFIVEANRSPFGKIGGKLSPVRPDDLLATVLKDLVSKINFPLLKLMMFLLVAQTKQAKITEMLDE